ncbi:MAG: PKD domain-containing protein [Solirubrobacteraceae bacterium]|nr:PKD domain-containing protein [Solirubrobacteraceae bacterium]
MRTAVLMIMCAAVVALPGSASAAAWVAPTTVAPAGSPVGSSEVVLDAAGNATAVWQVYAGAQSQVMASHRAAGSGAWGVPVPVSAAGNTQTDSTVAVAVDAAGNVTAVWDRASGGDARIQSSLRSAATGAWSAPVNLSAPSNDASTPRVAVDTSGTAVAAWDRFQPGGDIVVETSARPTPTGTWSTPKVMQTGQYGHSPDLATDATGVVAVWISEGQSRFVQSASRSSVSGTWSTAQALSPSLGSNIPDAFAPRVAANGSGHVAATWLAGQGIVRSSWRGPNGTWSAQQSNSAGSSGAASPVVAVDRQGNATVMWSRTESGFVRAQFSQRAVTASAWTPPVSAPPGGTNVYVSDLAYDPAGDLTVVFTRDTTPAGRGQALTRPAGATSWNAPVDLNGGAEVVAPRLRYDLAGNGVAIWNGANGSDITGVQAAGFDATPPQLDGLGSVTVPASGVAGQPVAVSASPIDIWSPIATTTWSFGDGGAATTRIADHTYAAEGSYTVTVTATDALGFATSATRTITIGAAPIPTPVPPAPPTPVVPGPGSVVPNPTPAPGTTPQSAPDDEDEPEAELDGKEIDVDVELRRRTGVKSCPKTAEATVSLKSKGRTISGKAKLKVKTVEVDGKKRCAATGTLKLSATPPSKTKVRVKVTGKGLTTRTVTAERD